MKKTYMQPSVEVVIIKQEVMLDSSPYSFSGVLGDGEVNGSAALGNDRYDFDDDEDLGSIIPW